MKAFLVAKACCFLVVVGVAQGCAFSEAPDPDETRLRIQREDSSLAMGIVRGQAEFDRPVSWFRRWVAMGVDPWGVEEEFGANLPFDLPANAQPAPLEEMHRRDRATLLHFIAALPVRLGEDEQERWLCRYLDLLDVSARYIEGKGEMMLLTVGVHHLALFGRMVDSRWVTRNRMKEVSDDLFDHIRRFTRDDWYRAYKDSPGATIYCLSVFPGAPLEHWHRIMLCDFVLEASRRDVSEWDKIDLMYFAAALYEEFGGASFRQLQQRYLDWRRGISLDSPTWDENEVVLVVLLDRLLLFPPSVYRMRFPDPFSE